MPSAAQEEDDEEILARIRVILQLAKNTDEKKGFPGVTLDDWEAFAYLKNQSGRCAVTANKMTCVPRKLNSFRHVIMPVTMCCRVLTTLPPQH